jgi:hypothetical protein
VAVFSVVVVTAVVVRDKRIGVLQVSDGARTRGSFCAEWLVVNNHIWISICS